MSREGGRCGRPLSSKASFGGGAALVWAANPGPGEPGARSSKYPPALLASHRGFRRCKRPPSASSASAASRTSSTKRTRWTPNGRMRLIGDREGRGYLSAVGARVHPGPAETALTHPLDRASGRLRRRSMSSQIPAERAGVISARARRRQRRRRDHRRSCRSVGQRDRAKAEARAVRPALRAGAA